jgi:hypothetical protein
MNSADMTRSDLDALLRDHGALMGLPGARLAQSGFD